MKSLIDSTVGLSLERLVAFAHRHLGMDAAFIAEFVEGEQICRALAGDAASFGFEITSASGGETYCSLMVDGDIPRTVPDTGDNHRLRRLPVTAHASIGAYVGVPLYLADGRLYGTLSCLSHEPQPDLNARDADFMAMLGELLTDELGAQARVRAEHRALRGLIVDEDLAIALQPVVELTTGACTGVEALARFPASFGTPDVVFAMAERTGLRFELERLAVYKAAELVPALAPHQSLAVNLSPDVAFELMRTIDEDYPLDQFVLEITEHAAIESYRCIRERLAPLRERGMRLAIDDAGAGFASLRHIVELRPDIIKIDRSLVGGCESDLARRSVITTFVLLALDIGARIVAEGVETEAELDAVAALGVDAVQGYLLARPSTDRAELARWLSGVSLLPAQADRR